MKDYWSEIFEPYYVKMLNNGRNKHILKVLQNPLGRSMENESYVTKLLPYMALVRNK